MNKLILSILLLFSISVYAQKSIKSRGSSIGGPSNEMIPNLDGGPNDALCIPGPGHCEGVVIVINCKPLREAIAKNSLKTFFDNETIKILSNGNVVLMKYLELVKFGKLYLREVEMPKYKGKRTAFIIGDKNLTKTNFITAIIAEEVK